MIFTGFVDGEGCFLIRILKNKNLKTLNIQLKFQIGLHVKDKALLEELKNYFGVGYIFKDRSQYIKYTVQSLKDLTIIIYHFDRYPLITQKFADYLLFKQAFNLMQLKEHLTKNGLQKIVAIKASLNLGLSYELKSTFPNITPVKKSLVTNQKISDPNWLAGFTSAKGCFSINLLKSPDHRMKERVKLIFQLSQHSRDEQLVVSLINYLDCGNVIKNR